MKKLIAGLLAALALGGAQAQVQTNFVYGQVLTADQLNSAFFSAAKTNGAVMTNAQIAGGVLSGMTISGSTFTGVATLTGLTVTGPTVLAGTTTTSLSATSLNVSGATVLAGLTASGTISLPASSVSYAALTNAPANTFLGNTTGSLASVVSNAIPSCSAAGSALNYIPGAGLTCNTSITAAHAAGTTGNLGELITLAGSTIGMTTGTPTNLASQAVTAGTYDVQVVVGFVPAATTAPTSLLLGPNSASAAFGAAGSFVNFTINTTGSAYTLVSPMVRLVYASSGTVFCVAQANFTVSTLSGVCVLNIRRVL